MDAPRPNERMSILERHESFLRLQKESNVRTCLLSSKEAFGNCSGPIVKAHSISNKRVLQRIASSDGQLYMMKPALKLGQPPTAKLKKVGVGDATVFTGFCSTHDQKLFKPIDIKDYEDGDSEQEHLFALRSVAIELWKKHCTIESSDGVAKMLGPVHPNDQVDLPELQKKVAEVALNELGTCMDRILGAVSHTSQDVLFTRSYHLGREVGIAASTVFHFDTDLNGNVINKFHDLNQPLKYLFFTVFPQAGDTIIVCSCMQEDWEVYGWFFDLLDDEVDSEQCINRVLTDCENVVFGEEVYKRLGPEGVNAFEQDFSRILDRPGSLELQQKRPYSVFGM